MSEFQVKRVGRIAFYVISNAALELVNLFSEIRLLFWPIAIVMHGSVALREWRYDAVMYSIKLSEHRRGMFWALCVDGQPCVLCITFADARQLWACLHPGYDPIE